MQTPLCPSLQAIPQVHPEAFVAPGAILLGEVTLSAKASIWYGAILRADLSPITIGTGTNLQDGVIVHLASDRGTVVGDYVTVGHRALLHACTIEDEVLIGMGAIVMDGAVIGRRSIVAAGAVVPKGLIVPPGSLVLGTPAKVARPLTEVEHGDLRGWAEKYIRVAEEHRRLGNGKPLRY